MVDKEKLARLAQALDDRADVKVANEAQRAAQAEADLQAHSNETRDMLGGKSLKYLTQAEYDVLSDEEKQNENVIYYITDLEDRTHDHYNKEVLDIMDDEFVKNLGKGQLLEMVIPADAGWYRVAAANGSGAGLIDVQCGHGEYIIMIGHGENHEPNMVQLGMCSMGGRRNNLVRVIHHVETHEAYLELRYEAGEEDSDVKIQILGESDWKLNEPVKTEAVDETVYHIKEMELVPGKIVGEFNGVIEKAGKLAEPVQVIIGNVHREFDGTADIAFSLNEIGAAPRETDVLTTDAKVVVDAINELDADLGVVEQALGGYKIWVGNTEELNAIEERDPMTLYFEISDSVAYTEINPEVGNEGIATTEIYDEMIPAYNPEPEQQDVILTSPAGFKFKLLVDDFGNLSTIPVE
jgi:hypothetical protein